MRLSQAANAASPTATTRSRRRPAPARIGATESPASRVSLALLAGRAATVVLLDNGGGQAVIRGTGKGTVVGIAGSNITLRGFAITGSGESHDAVDAGILVEGSGHLIEDNRIEDVLFGIHLRQARNTTVRNNRVTGKPLESGLRGDAIRMWNGAGNRTENNRFVRARDLTFINSADTTFLFALLLGSSALHAALPDADRAIHQLSAEADGRLPQGRAAARHGRGRGG